MAKKDSMSIMNEFKNAPKKEQIKANKKKGRKRRKWLGEVRYPFAK